MFISSFKLDFKSQIFNITSDFWTPMYKQWQRATCKEWNQNITTPCVVAKSKSLLVKWTDQSWDTLLDHCLLQVDFDQLQENLCQMERRCKASWDHLKVIAKHEIKPALKQRMSDFLKDCAERIIILKIVHRRIINR